MIQHIILAERHQAVSRLVLRRQMTKLDCVRVEKNTA